MTQTMTASPEIIITEEYAVELTKTGRGIIAEVKDAGSPHNGMYALGSIANCALTVLKTKIREKESR